MTIEVAAVTRALSILDAFNAMESALTLGELARRTRVHKTTVLRIARTMAASRYLMQCADGSWRLGPAAGWLGARYQMTFDRAAAIEPILRELSRQTGESASFYVREGDIRTCLVRIDGPQTIRHHVRVGEMLPLIGAPGHVLRAFSGEAGTLYERIRRLGYHTTAGERDPQVASVACPVLGRNQSLIGCVVVSGPIARFTAAMLRRHLRALQKVAATLSVELSSTLVGPAVLRAHHSTGRAS
jgi:DNA-binding IclR family transcriptional regulator